MGEGPPEGRAGELSGVPRLPPASGWKVRIERTAKGYLVHRLLNYPSLVKKSSFYYLLNINGSDFFSGRFLPSTVTNLYL